MTVDPEKFVPKPLYPCAGVGCGDARIFFAEDLFFVSEGDPGFYCQGCIDSMDMSEHKDGPCLDAYVTHTVSAPYVEGEDEDDDDDSPYDPYLWANDSIPV